MEIPKMEIPKVDAESTAKLCFACSHENPIGLKLKPVHDGEKVTAEFTAGEFHQGWNNVVHGGILYTLLDEATAYAMLCHGVEFGVTAKSEIRFKKVAPINEPIQVSAWVTKLTKRLVETKGVLTLKDNTIKFTKEYFTTLFGTRNDFIIHSVMGGALPEEDVKIIIQEKEENFRRKATGHINPFPGAVRLLNIIKKGNFKLGLVSSAPKENIDLVLSELNLEGIFDCIVFGREVPKSKPNPQVYLLAAEKLKVAPKDCLAIEDSPLGVKAAKTAGMKCLAITNTHPWQKLKEADKVVDSGWQIGVRLFRINLDRSQDKEEGD